MRNFLVIARPRRPSTESERREYPRDRKKTSMQMDRPVEFSRSTYETRARTRGCSCVGVRVHVLVNMGCASTRSFLPLSLSLSLSRSRPAPIVRSLALSFVFVYGHVEQRIRGGERPSFPHETKLRGN